ncbi:hypothetical protein AB0D13_00255 [Streptomyces sp. NPDC048430]|uniref:hypothetical protein n=1 Tax=Streptomyces sp. NPDC048430 TaxID=3155388 RepID=UPI00343CE1CC
MGDLVAPVRDGDLLRLERLLRVGGAVSVVTSDVDDITAYAATLPEADVSAVAV